MADDEMVDGAGWISDESSFYGTINTAAASLTCLGTAETPQGMKKL